MDERKWKPITVGDVVAICCPGELLGTFLVRGIRDDYVIVEYKGKFLKGSKLVEVSRHWIVNREFIEEDGA